MRQVLVDTNVEAFAETRRAHGVHHNPRRPGLLRYDACLRELKDALLEWEWRELDALDFGHVLDREGLGVAGHHAVRGPVRAMTQIACTMPGM